MGPDSIIAPTTPEKIVLKRSRPWAPARLWRVRATSEKCCRGSSQFITNLFKGCLYRFRRSAQCKSRRGAPVLPCPRVSLLAGISRRPQTEDGGGFVRLPPKIIRTSLPRSWSRPPGFPRNGAFRLPGHGAAQLFIEERSSGVATALKRCRSGQFAIHAQALRGNPYDGYTLARLNPRSSSCRQQHRAHLRGHWISRAQPAAGREARVSTMTPL
jgi:hypothetical protein